MGTINVSTIRHNHISMMTNTFMQSRLGFRRREQLIPTLLGFMWLNVALDNKIVLGITFSH